ncbi:MAG: DUF1501 domain-containing protein [Cyclobacteriaceae bacterium]
MKRRNFLKKVGFAAGVPIAFQGVPLTVLGSHQRLQRLAAQSDNDRVIIMIQLHGGNDGLNTVIPLSNYDEYYSRRANIAIPYKVGNRTLIPLDSTIAAEDQVGVHPDMHDFKHLYDVGKAAVFQGVSYENNNGSHFRGRDIWFMGGDSDDYFSSGWIGRYLGKEYEPLSYPEDFPTTEMPDPLALEMGNDVSLLFHQEGNIPTSISLGSDPSNLENLINQLEGFVDEGIDPRGNPPSFLNNSPYGQEMNWILGLEEKSETYIRRLSEIYDSAAETSVTYPETYPFNSPTGAKRNPLSNQLKLIARLMAGGIKTKVFLVKMGGFDTHASQVETNDPTMGLHGALLYHISSAMRAFLSDLRSRGMEDRALALTMSEFGRRIGSNGSYGTDHGTGGPILMFGLGVKQGIYGTVPDVSQSNVGLQFDYRQVYSNILHEWMGVDKEVITNDIFFRNFIDGANPAGGNYEPMDLIKEVILGEKDVLKSKYRIQSLYPNPATNYTQVKIQVNNFQEVKLQLIDINGRIVSEFVRNVAPGEHTFSFMLDKVSPGFYFVKAKSQLLDDTKRLLVRK